MRVIFFVQKLFCLFILITILIIIHINMKRTVQIEFFKVWKKSFNANTTKYILLWTSPQTVPFSDMGEGQTGFIKRNCPHVNCYVTGNRTYLGDIKRFDVIVFAAPQLIGIINKDLPTERSLRQKYVFASIESPENYPLLSYKLNNYFNWTWTYKLDSEVRWGYIVIRDSKGNIIGPKKEMHWIKLQDMDPVSKDLEKRIKSKKKAAAWFVSNCFSASRREEVAKEIKIDLMKNYHVLDIYGNCGLFSCSKDKADECNKMIEDKYYFYLSFENSLSEDYVTEKLLIAVQYNIVPVVFGGANYSRFLPDGSYLDARKLGVPKLVEKMIELIKNPKKYLEYFRWKNHYSYHKTSESVETNEYCKMCSLLNDDDMMRRNSIYDDLQTWWNEPDFKSNVVYV
ncbi:hypothetical protein K1T71_007344 [Dendrolimus kikuchii]|uniref:Uncharacterized protein n=1 Tax=Dendrolimus kikuchii TaxID=765133 RepID=A0ACC1D0R4_9NEOP|nr:hypothetical protein K1T71_007344 [Dendrolimus kikuchii]